MEQIETKINVDLASLAVKLAENFDLELTTAGSDKKTQSKDIDLVFKSKNGIESLSISRNYSDYALDYERLSVYHYNGERELTKILYHASKLEYFKKMFQDLKSTDNEFLLAVKRDYEEILRRNQRYGPTYEKIVSSDQKALEKLFNYAAFKFKGLNSSA